MKDVDDPLRAGFTLVNGKKRTKVDYRGIKPRSAIAPKVSQVSGYRKRADYSHMEPAPLSDSNRRRPKYTRALPLTDVSLGPRYERGLWVVNASGIFFHPSKDVSAKFFQFAHRDPRWRDVLEIVSRPAVPDFDNGSNGRSYYRYIDKPDGSCSWSNCSPDAPGAKPGAVKYKRGQSYASIARTAPFVKMRYRAPVILAPPDTGAEAAEAARHNKEMYTLCGNPDPIYWLSTNLLTGLRVSAKSLLSSIRALSKSFVYHPYRSVLAGVLASILISRFGSRYVPAIRFLSSSSPNLELFTRPLARGNDLFSAVASELGNGWTGAFTDVGLYAYLRTFIGLPFIYRQFRFNGFVADYERFSLHIGSKAHTVVGKGPFDGQSLFIDSPAQLSLCPTVSFGIWSRHSSALNLPGKNRVVLDTYVSPQSWHVCTSACAHFNSTFFSDEDGFHSVAGVDVILSRDCVYLRYSTSNDVYVLPRHKFNDALTRYYLSSTVGKFSIISTILNDYIEAQGMVMTLVHNGFLKGAYVPLESKCVVTFQYSNAYPDATGMAITMVHHPVMGDSLAVPGKSESVMLNAVLTRLREPAVLTAFPLEYGHLVHEFVDEYIRPIAPLSYEDMAARMTRVTQRVELESLSSYFGIDEARVSLFNKREPVGFAKPARVIVTFQGSRNYLLSSYTLALSDSLVGLPFWGPGKPPSEIQQRVHLMHSGQAFDTDSRSDAMLEGDYSKFDATVGVPLWIFMRAVYARAFPKNHSDLESLLEETRNAWAGTRFGVSYQVGFGTQSGSADTTIRNTLWNAFITYASFRTNDRFSKEQSHSYLKGWLFLGDDSLGRTHGADFVSTASRFGLKLEARLYRRGPTRFLGRFYPDPWSTVGCIADIPRFLRRFHLIDVKSGQDIHEAMAQTAYGRLVNDPDTPLLSSYCKAVLKAHPVSGLNPTYHDPWKYLQLINGDIYLNDDYTPEQLFTAIALDMSVPAESLLSLDLQFQELDAVYGTVYDPITINQSCLPPGLVVDGMPVGKLPIKPIVKISRRQVDAYETALEDNVLDEYSAFRDVSSKSPTSDVLPDNVTFITKESSFDDCGLVDSSVIGNDEAEPPRCHVCDSRYHATSLCPTCSYCGERGHAGEKCVDALIDSYTPIQVLQPKNGNKKTRRSRRKKKVVSTPIDSVDSFANSRK